MNIGGCLYEFHYLHYLPNMSSVISDLKLELENTEVLTTLVNTYGKCYDAFGSECFGHYIIHTRSPAYIKTLDK